MDEFNVSEELANVRIEAVLDLPEVNAFQLPGQRNLETSTILLGGAVCVHRPYGTSVAAYMAKINESVQGAYSVRVMGCSHSKIESALPCQRRQQTSTMTAQTFPTTTWASALRPTKL
jgi:hypothetical protein